MCVTFPLLVHVYSVRYGALLQLAATGSSALPRVGMVRVVAVDNWQFKLLQPSALNSVHNHAQQNHHIVSMTTPF